MLAEKPMRIGISVDTSQQPIWQNGAYQTAIFLAATFQRLPFVQSVLLIDVAPGGCGTTPEARIVSDIPMASAREAGETVNVIIELAGVLDPQWLRLMRARGKKLVRYQTKQPYAHLAEPAIFGRPGENRWGTQYDEIWLSGQDTLFASLMRTAHRCAVYEVPYLWHPEFVEQRSTRIQAHGFRYGYVCQKDDQKTDIGMRVAIFEPNVSVVRSSSIPMLICDDAYRADPTSVKAMHVLNSLHMKDHATLRCLANSLDIVRAHRATFHGLHDVVSFMSQFADVVVAHQWQKAQNYTALDVLYGNYPLIHNAEWMKEAGYYYPDFDITAGARLLRQVAEEHGRALDEYRGRSRQLFSQIDPFRQFNLDAYASRLRRLCRRDCVGESA